MWRPKVNFGSSFSGDDDLVSVRQSLIGLELSYEARVAGQGAPGICLSLSH